MGEDRFAGTSSEIPRTGCSFPYCKTVLRSVLLLRSLRLMSTHSRSITCNRSANEYLNTKHRTASFFYPSTSLIITILPATICSHRSKNIQTTFQVNMRSFMALFLSMLNMFLMVGAAPTSNLSTSSGFIFVYSWGAGVIPARNGCLTAHGAWDYTDSACGTFQPVTTAPTITVAGTFKSSVGLCSFHSPDKSFVCCPSQIVGAPFKVC